MKVICETTGDFMLVDYSNNGQTVHAGEINVVEVTPFINSRAMIGQLRFLGEVNDEATDAELQKFIKEADDDVDLAIASFLSTFGLESAPVTSKKGKKAKAKAVVDTKENPE